MDISDIKVGEGLYCIHSKNDFEESWDVWWKSTSQKNRYQMYNSSGLTFGREYFVISYLDGLELVLVKNDYNVESWYRFCFFGSIKDIRRKKLDNIFKLE